MISVRLAAMLCASGGASEILHESPTGPGVETFAGIIRNQNVAMIAAETGVKGALDKF